jgi:hypothetical protein
MFRDYNGAMLLELKNLKLDSPETFAVCIEHELKAGQLTTSDVLLINMALRRL